MLYWGKAFFLVPLLILLEVDYRRGEGRENTTCESAPHSISEACIKFLFIKSPAMSTALRVRLPASGLPPLMLHSSILKSKEGIVKVLSGVLGTKIFL